MDKFICALTGFVAFGFTTTALAGEVAGSSPPLKVLSEGRGTLFRANPTVQFVVHSERANQDFLVQVTPPGSAPWLPGQKAAVAYVLDGGFGIVAPAARYVGGTRAMLPAYVVTIAYAARGSRERDLLFAHAIRPDGSEATGGGGEAFMAFLLEELRPFIEAKYPVDPEKSVLAGDSLAGLFTANVLARRPDAFSGYLIGSPSVWADPEVVDRLRRVRPERQSRVFVAYGEAEVPYMVRGGHGVARAVARNRALISREHVVRDADHRSAFPELMAQGLSYLLPQTRPIAFSDPVHPPLETLRRYEGVYVLSDGRKMEVSLKEGRLTTALASPVELYPTRSPGRFLVEGYNAELIFEEPKNGAANLLRVVLNGDEAVARRTP